MQGLYFVWVDEGNDPDYDKLVKHGISGVSLSLREATIERLDELPLKGFQAGVYFAQNWYDAATGHELADLVSARLQELAPGSPFDFPRVCCDIETHDVVYLLEFFRRWRAHRPRRLTDFALEGFQGGLFSEAVAQELTLLHVNMVPSNYKGDMRPWAADRVALDLVDRGFAPDRLFGFYDGAALPAGWQGYVCTQGRLP